MGGNPCEIKFGKVSLVSLFVFVSLIKTVQRSVKERGEDKLIMLLIIYKNVANHVPVLIFFLLLFGGLTNISGLNKKILRKKKSKQPA